MRWPLHAQPSALPIESCVAGTIVYPPGGTYGPVYYQVFQLLLLHSGSMDVQVDDAHYKLVPGQMLLLVPGHHVFIAFDRAERSWHRWITITPGEMSDELQREWELPVHELPISEQMNQLVDLAVRQQRQQSPEHQQVLRTFGLAAMELYAAERLNHGPLGTNRALQSAKSFIGEAYGQPIALGDLAAGANVSPSHLVRLFRQYEHISPMQYLWRYRVERGLDLLRTTGLSIGDIAESCGFKTSYHFARLVKAHTGRTPTEVRSDYWRRRQT